MTEIDIKVTVANLHTETGVAAVASQMANAVVEEMLRPVLEHTPMRHRVQLFENFMRGLMGAACGLYGHDKAVEIVGEVRTTLLGVIAQRQAQKH